MTEATINPVPCARCGGVPEVDHPCGCIVYCRECYDGAPDGNRESGIGTNRENAVRSWNCLMGKVKADLEWDAEREAS